VRGGRLVGGLALSLVALTLGSPHRSDAQNAVDRMTLREKVGQLVMFSVAGKTLSSHERDVMARRHLGSVILFEHNYRNEGQLRRLTAQIQSAARRGTDPSIGALIAVDQEGGIVKRFEDMPPWHSAPEMAARGRSFTAKQGRRTGRALSSAGVNVDLAPVADLDIPPEHVMRERSFGSRPRKVGSLVAAFGKGLQDHRVVATAKHFPGIGGATQNTDDGPSYVSRSKRKLRRTDRVPFERAVDARFGMVMVGHAMYLKEGGRIPASMSRHIINDRLRRDLGFEGVAITDALEAVGWRFNGNIAKACKQTIAAGIDMALISSGVDDAVRCADSIRRAVLNDKISIGRIDEAVARVIALKTWAGVAG
jgi:beta-N-acetylhexosaminidase